MMSRLAALALAACLTAAFPAAAAPKPPSGDAMRLEFRADFGSSDTGRLMMQAFPDEYVALENRLVAARQAGTLTQDQAKQMVADFYRETNPQVGPWSTKAPAAQLQAVVGDELAFYELMQVENPQACMLAGAGKPLPPNLLAALSPKARQLVRQWRADQLRAVIAARQNPVERQPYGLEDKDWLQAAYLKHGVDPAWWDALLGGGFSDMDDATRCRNDIAVARTWQDLGGDYYGRYLMAKFSQP